MGGARVVAWGTVWLMAASTGFAGVNGAARPLRKRAYGRPTLAFAGNVKQSEHAAALFGRRR
jgi:hypothetical protein